MDKKLAEAGFTAEPSPAGDGFWTLHYRGELVVNEEAARHKDAAGAVTAMVRESVGEGEEGAAE